MIKIYSLVLLLAIITSCNNGKKTHNMNMNNIENKAEIYADTMKLYPSIFNKQIICNGKLEAIEKSDLSFINGGIVSAIHIKNGAYVKAGQLLAETDKSEYLLQLARAQKDLARANVELSDKLIGLGYNGITDKIPEDLLKRAKATCGYYSAIYEVQSAKQHLAKCNLYAPYSGRIADLTNARFQRIEKLCTLINDAMMDVSFDVLEAELKNIHINQEVKISLLADEQRIYTGKITSINPTINNNGLVRIKARIPNNTHTLIAGMNVKIIIESKIPNSFVVPKDAVVERDGYHVVFVYSQGEAIWTYVDIAHSNADYYAITGNQVKGTEINTGDAIITTGNLNLADGTKIKIRRRKDKQ